MEIDIIKLFRVGKVINIKLLEYFFSNLCVEIPSIKLRLLAIELGFSRAYIYRQFVLLTELDFLRVGNNAWYVNPEYLHLGPDSLSEAIERYKSLER